MSMAPKLMINRLPQMRTLYRTRGRPRKGEVGIDLGTLELQARRRVLSEFILSNSKRYISLDRKLMNRALCGSWLHLFYAREDITLPQFKAGLDYLHLSYHVHRLKGIPLHLRSSLRFSLSQKFWDNGDEGNPKLEAAWRDLACHLKHPTKEGGTYHSLLSELIYSQGNLDTLQFRWSKESVQAALDHLINSLKEIRYTQLI